MANYLLSVLYPAGRTRPAPDELEIIGRNVGALRDEMVEAGVWLFGGGLAPADSAAVVEARGDGQLVTDGPYGEGAEHLGGLCVIDVARPRHLAVLGGEAVPGDDGAGRGAPLPRLSAALSALHRGPL